MKIKSVSEWNGNGRPLIIAGPCAAESKEQLMTTAKEIAAIDSHIIFRAGIWKPRTRPGSFQGIGAEALPWLAEVQSVTGLTVCTEVATKAQVEACLEHGINTLWIGARTTVNPFYVEEIANAVKGKNVRIMVKNPIHPDINAWIGSIERFYHAGVEYLMAIHRGFHPLPASKYRNYPNWPIPIELKQRYPSLPIITDPSHITGNRQMIAKVSQDALDMHMDGLMIETHINPPNALSDKEQQVTPQELQHILLGLQVHRDPVLPPQNLEELRHDIDQLDYQLLKILKQRMECAKTIGKIKMDNDLALFQPDRWNQLLAARVQWGEEMGLRDFFTTELFKAIHSESIALQKKLWRE